MTVRTALRWTCLQAALLCLLATSLPAATIEEDLQRLRKNSVATETDGILDFLKRLQADPNRQAEIARLIEQLADLQFAKRKAATTQLAMFGEEARAQIAAATRSDDPEIRKRSRDLLTSLNSEDELERRRSLLSAAPPHPAGPR